MPHTFVALDGNADAVTRLRAHHEQALHEIATMIVTWSGGAAVAIWDAETDIRIVQHGSSQLRLSYALAASLMSSFETCRRLSKRPTVRHDFRACTCVGVGFKFSTVRRAGGLIAMHENTAEPWSPQSLALLHDFAAMIEAQCELFDTVMRLRMEALDIAARIAIAGVDGFCGELADGAMAKCLPRGAVCVFDENMRYLYADGESLKVLTGRPREQLQGFTLHQTAAAEDCVYLDAVFRNALAGKTLKADISENGRNFEAQALPIRNPQGNVVAGALVLQDVTRLRHLEAKLAISASALRIGSASDASATIDVASNDVPVSGTASAAGSTI